MADVVFCTAADVVKRLRRALTPTETTYAPDAIEEAQALVVAYLNRGPTPYAPDNDVPAAVRIVTSRMVARVFQQADQPVGVQQMQTTAGPFNQGTSFATGTNSGSPWLANADKVTLKPYRLDMVSVAFNSERGYGLRDS